MTTSRNWTINEASADLPTLLEAAKTSTQYIVSPDGRFEVSFRRNDQRSITELLETKTALRKDDINGI